jgi:hypothetical protein
MSEQRPDTAGPNPRRRPPTFKPRGTVGLLYLTAFFFLFSFLQILPDLVGLLGEVAPGEAQEQAAEELARQKVNVLASLALALIATWLGAWLKILPGLREG